MLRQLLSAFLKVLIAPALVATWATLAFAANATKDESGKYFDSDGNPAYHVGADGTVDWYTYSGFRRYHSECHVCHGPDALGSSFAPALATSMKDMSYSDFLEVVVNGRENVGTSAQNKMPSFGLNKNVMCYIDDLYVYLKARADDAVGRGRPAKKEAKTEATGQEEDACMQ